MLPLLTYSSYSRLTEPFILLLIILNAVILTIQAFPSLTLPTANGPALPPRVRGYFHSWEDYVLFALFIVFTCVISTSYPLLTNFYDRLEAIARICVTGFLFDPEVSIFTLFSSPFSMQKDPYTPNPAQTPGMARQTSLARGRSITQRFKQFRRTVMRPFALSARPPATAYPQTSFPQTASLSASHYRNGSANARGLDTGHRLHASIHNPSEPTFLSLAMRSEDHATHPDSIALPFRLSIGHLHEKTHRNVPYLRQSWSRIDFVAIVSFWISFILAMTGHERGTYHIGLFRAMSVIRTARLLTITSGTTVSYGCFEFIHPGLPSC